MSALFTPLVGMNPHRLDSTRLCEPHVNIAKELVNRVASAGVHGFCLKFAGMSTDQPTPQLRFRRFETFLTVVLILVMVLMPLAMWRQLL
jgi:hypothetical protein